MRQMGWRAAVSAACIVGLAWQAGSPRAWAISRQGSEAEEFSPLFSRRLEVGILNMDRPSGRVFTAGLFYAGESPVDSPFSGNPLSVCIGSGCLLSVCLGSACINSRCLGSGCVVSGCGGSACVASICGGSSCIASVCGGSACVGTSCAGSACVTCGASPDPEAILVHG